LSIFENIVINDVKNTLEFREFESLLRLSFILAEMDSWLLRILPHLVLDSSSTGKVVVSKTYQQNKSEDTDTTISTSIRTPNDEEVLQERLLLLFENGIASYEELRKCKEDNSNGAVSLILSELFRSYLKEGEVADHIPAL
jgi:hypothetical protein